MCVVRWKMQLEQGIKVTVRIYPTIRIYLLLVVTCECATRDRPQKKEKSTQRACCILSGLKVCFLDLTNRRSKEVLLRLSG